MGQNRRNEYGVFFQLKGARNRLEEAVETASNESLTDAVRHRAGRRIDRLRSTVESLEEQWATDELKPSRDLRRRGVERPRVASVVTSVVDHHSK